MLVALGGFWYSCRWVGFGSLCQVFGCVAFFGESPVELLVAFGWWFVFLVACVSFWQASIGFGCCWLVVSIVLFFGFGRFLAICNRCQVVGRER